MIFYGCRDVEVRKRENEKLREIVGKKYEFSVDMFGNSPSIRDVFKMIEKAAASQITVSITGETGTGKELVLTSTLFFISIFNMH
jgi:DNA-binding NtrC family response regulator